jgi:hypothetical protein
MPMSRFDESTNALQRDREANADVSTNLLASTSTF